MIIANSLEEVDILLRHGAKLKINNEPIKLNFLNRNELENCEHYLQK